MQVKIRKSALIIAISLLLLGIFLFFVHYLPLASTVHWKLYDALVKIEYKFNHPPPEIKNIVLVTIDNDTIKNMAERWPYPRSYFARAIENLRSAGAGAIGFDFAFFGKSNPSSDDALLIKSLEGENGIVLATTINEKGSLDRSTIPGLSGNIPSGIVTKLQDPDGIMRRNLTYLVSDKEPHKGFLSWEMQIFKTAKGLKGPSLSDDRFLVSLRGDTGEKWTVPVDPDTKSFLINFRAHTVDFNRISFYNVQKGDFDPVLVKNKIVLVGLVSLLFGDLHNTPLGWLPGLTLNANAFLTLYAQDFIDSVAWQIEVLTILAGVILSAFFISFFSMKKAIVLILGEVLLFFLLSYILLARGWIWNYSVFPTAIMLCPVLGKKISLLFHFKGSRL